MKEKKKTPAIEVMTKRQRKLLYRRIERVTPETYRCGVKIERR